MRKFFKVFGSLFLSAAISFLMIPVYAENPAVDVTEKSVEMVKNGSAICTVEEAIQKIDFDQEVRDAKIGVIGKNVNNNILNSIDVESAEDQEVSYSVKNLGQVLENGKVSGTLYSLTALSSIKNTSGTHDEDNVHCYMSVVWIDNLGPNNELQAVNGGWVTERSLYDRNVYYGVDDTMITKTPSGNSFSYNNIGVEGLQIHAVSTVKSQGYNPVIMLTVTPGIGD